MQNLQGQELEQEDEIYNMIFGERSSDDEFDPKSEELEEDSESIHEKQEKDENDEESEKSNKEADEEKSLEIQIEEEREKKRAFKKRGRPQKNNKEPDMYDLDMIDLDLIDEIEDKKDRGIYQSEEDKSSHEENESDWDGKKKKKKDDTKFLNKKKGRNNKRDKKGGVPIIEEAEEKKVRYTKKFIEDENNQERKKRTKFGNKLKHLSQKKQKIKLNKYVVVHKNNPDAIIIFKKALEENNEQDDDIMKYNDADYKNYNEDDEEDNARSKKAQKGSAKEPTVRYTYGHEIPSQKEILFEAIFTEYHNIKSLEEMQRLEDLNKKEMNRTTKKQLTDYVRTKISIREELKKEELTLYNIEENKISNEQKPVEIPTFPNSISFSNAEIYKKIFENFNRKPETKKEEKVCAVTGNPAKYFDPLTKSFYSNVESFKILRERYFQKEEDGLLFRIQTLSDLASQKKEKIKKLLLTSDTPNNKSDKQLNSNNTKSLINLVNKYGILKNDSGDLEKKIISRMIII